MKISKPYILFLLLPLIIGCISPKCDKNIDSWIAEAPEALNEFLLVKEEILNNRAFLDSLSRSGSGTLFIGGSVLDTSDFAAFSMPRLKQWFKRGRGYISFNGKDTSFLYKSCENGSATADGLVYYAPTSIPHKYKASVQIVDSARFNGVWLAHVIECQGCNE